MSSETQLQKNGTLGSIYKSDLGVFTDVSWEPDKNLPKEEWMDAIYRFEKGRKTFPFYIGDGLNWGFNQWGEMYEELSHVLGLAYQTLANYKWVCKAVPPEIRNTDELEWEHHKVVASMGTRDEQVYWLGKAVENGWTTREFKRAVKGEHVVLIGNIESVNRSKRKLLTEFFSLAYADKSIIDKWLGELSREEVNRLTDGEVQGALTRLMALVEILELY